MSNLETETRRWQKKLEDKISELEKENEEGEDFIENIKAYYKDSFYFLEQHDYVRAFECVVWAWAWFEIGRDYGFVSIKE